MVDADGRPKVLYHGTSHDFDSFKCGEHGIFFAEDPKVASSFAAAGGKWDGTRVIREGARILPVYLSIQNPWTLISYPDDFPYSQMVDQSSAALAASGYDACFRPGDGAWIVFSPNQVKSRFNSGMFSLDSDDLLDADVAEATQLSQTVPDRPRVRP